MFLAQLSKREKQHGQISCGLCTFCRYFAGCDADCGAAFSDCRPFPGPTCHLAAAFVCALKACFTWQEHGPITQPN